MSKMNQHNTASNLLCFYEVGNNGQGIGCDNDATWIRDLWLGAFTGICTGPLLWDNQHRHDLWPHLGRIRSFVSGCDFNEDGGWMAGHDPAYYTDLYSLADFLLHIPSILPTNIKKTFSYLPK